MRENTFCKVLEGCWFCDFVAALWSCVFVELFMVGRCGNRRNVVFAFECGV